MVMLNAFTDAESARRKGQTPALYAIDAFLVSLAGKNDGAHFFLL
jgi:hypothetical protein